MKKSKNIKRIIIFLVIILMLLGGFWLYIENSYNTASKYIEKGYYYKAFEIFNNIYYYRDSRSIVDSDEMLFHLMIETMNVEYIGDDIIIPDIVGLNAARICYVLDKLEINYKITYMTKKSAKANSVIDYSINVNESDEKTVNITINDYYCNSKENVIYANHIFTSIAEKGEFLYIANKNNIYKCLPDFKDLESIYQGEDEIFNIAVIGEDIYFTENRKLYSISICGENKEIVCEYIVSNFMANKDTFLVNAYENEKCVGFKLDVRNNNLIKIYDEPINYTYYEDSVFNILSEEDAIIDNILTNEKIEFPIDNGCFQAIDTDNNVLLIIDEKKKNEQGRIMLYKLLDYKQTEYRYVDVVGQACVNKTLFVCSDSRNGRHKEIHILNLLSEKEYRLKNNELPKYFGPFLSVHGDYIFSKYSGEIVRKCYNIYTNEFVEIGIGIGE